eukprot:752701-Hanusia_phi.AAC.1
MPQQIRVADVVDDDLRRPPAPWMASPCSRPDSQLAAFPQRWERRSPPESDHHHRAVSSRGRVTELACRHVSPLLSLAPSFPLAFPPLDQSLAPAYSSLSPPPPLLYSLPVSFPSS